MDYQTALRQLMNKPFTKTPKYREQQTRCNRHGAYYDKDSGLAPIVEFERAFVRDLRRRGIPFFCHNMVRTFEEQDELFARGVSKAKGGQSAHNYGMAGDLIHGIHGWNIDRKSWEIIGHIGYEVANRLGIEIQWGGEWDFYDPAHWELANWKQLAGIE